MPEDPERQKAIWLEVTNVRLGPKLELQVKGDKAEREPVWWHAVGNLGFSDKDKAYRTLTESLDKKRIVLAELGPPEGLDPKIGMRLECQSIRIQYAESNSR